MKTRDFKTGKFVVTEKFECLVDGCFNLVIAKGYCNKHYRSFKKYGFIPIRNQFDKNEILVNSEYAEMKLYDRYNNVKAITIIDIEDVARVLLYKWHLDNLGYVRSNKLKCSLQRYIMNGEKGFIFDHKNQQPLDNRKDNLRLCSSCDNQRNRAKQINNTSGFKGVSLIKTTGLWRAQIGVAGKTLNLGHFVSKIEAFACYEKAALKYHKSFARTIHDANYVPPIATRNRQKLSL